MSQIPDSPLAASLKAIDAANRADPSRARFAGALHPTALIEGLRAYHWVEQLRPGAPQPLLIAARGHHIKRWTVPRDSYARGREGYLAWRTYLYSFHAAEVARIMHTSGYAEGAVEHASRILHKRGIKTDADVQCYEDAVSLAFIELRLGDFAPTVSEEQLVRALKRTLAKMSAAGRDSAGALDVDAATARALAALEP